MSAVMEAREASAIYLSALQQPLVQHFELLTTAPSGVARLRQLILTLAVRGRLVQQDPREEPANELLQRIRAEKGRLVAKGKIKLDKVSRRNARPRSFALPEGWEQTSLGDYFLELCTGPFGSVVHKEDYIEGGVPLINPSHMVGGRISHDPSVSIKPTMAESLNAYRLSAGDVLLARRGEVGRYALVTQAEEGWLCGTGSFFVKLHESCNRLFLGLVFEDPTLRRHLLGESVGATMTNLNQRILLDTTIAVPPIAEQSRIVTRVEELMRLCDALEAKGQLEAAQHTQLVQTLLGALTASVTSEELAKNWQRVATHFDLLLDRPEAIDALEQTILQLAVRGLLVSQDPNDEPASELLQKIRGEKDRLIAEGKIKREKPLALISEEERPFVYPRGWEQVRMGHLIELVSGQHLGPNEYVEGLGASIPYLTGPAEFGAVSPAPSRSTNERRAVSIQADILITVKGSGVGKLNVVAEPEVAISRQLMAIRPLMMDSKFLMLVLQTMAMHFQEKSIGIAIPGIGREDVTHTLIGLPPLSEQSRIVARVESLRRLCADLRQRLTARQTTQAHLSEALIASASA